MYNATKELPEGIAMQDVIEKEIIVRAPQERVYAALTDPEKLAGWFPDAVEGKIAPGERPILDFGEYGKSKIYIVATDPYYYFAYRWVSGSVTIPDGFLGDVLTRPHTLVEFHLEAVSEGTRVKLVESGFSTLAAEVMQTTYNDNTEGWEYMLGRLGEFAEKD